MKICRTAWFFPHFFFRFPVQNPWNHSNDSRSWYQHLVMYCPFDRVWAFKPHVWWSFYHHVCEILSWTVSSQEVHETLGLPSFSRPGPAEHFWFGIDQLFKNSLRTVVLSWCLFYDVFYSSSSDYDILFLKKCSIFLLLNTKTYTVAHLAVCL